MKPTLKFRLFSLAGLCAVVLFLAYLPAAGQSTEPLKLRLNRIFGYSMGSEMQGTFNLKATGPGDLTRVTFYIDGAVLAEDTEAPFQVQIHTDNYQLGTHTFSAAGVTSSGAELASNQIQGKFVSAAEGGSAGLRILIPVLAVVLGAFVVSTLLTLATSSKLRNLPPGAPRSYGFSGGAICPSCGRPFGMHVFGLNLVVGKLDRCPFCGKWSLMRRASPEALRHAEQAELLQAKGEGGAPVVSEEEKLRREMEASRYQDV